MQQFKAIYLENYTQVEGTVSSKKKNQLSGSSIFLSA